MEKKGKRIESESVEIPLPEAMIQHIQSYLSGKEAARTTILSKSWYDAWLTRPVLDFDFVDFLRGSWTVFEEYAKTTMQRYQSLSLKIECFRLHMTRGCSWVHDLIVNAINIGATDVQIDIPNYAFTLPKEVLGSQTLLRLSLSMCRIDGNFVCCSRLQSLIIDNIKITSDDGFKDIISCCGLIEELSVYYCSGLTLSLENLHKLAKLRRLVLSRMDVDSMFFTDFASRFPCLKDLSVNYCRGFTRIHIVSTSLETICLMTSGGSWKAKFDVPNIRKVTYSGSVFVLSQLSIKGGSTKWELDVSIDCDRVHMTWWFLNLKMSLKKFRLSRISVSLNLYCRPEHEVDIEVLPKSLVVENLMINTPSSLCRGGLEHEVDIEVLPKPLVVENLIIKARSSSSSLCLALLVRLFVIFRPKFITHKFCSLRDDNASFATLCQRLMEKPVTPNCGIPDQYLFGQFGLKKVNMEVYEMVDGEWLPLLLEKPLDPSKTPVSKQKIRYELIWD